METASDNGLYQAAALLLQCGKPGEATKLLDRMSRSGAMASSPLAVKANTLRGWVEVIGLPAGSPTASLQVESYFSSSLEAAHDDLDALLGLSACRCAAQDWPGALAALDRAIASSPGFAPALVEKARVMVAKGDWIQAEVMASRAVAEDPQCLAALRILCLYSATQLPLSQLEGSNGSDVSGGSSDSGSVPSVKFSDDTKQTEAKRPSVACQLASLCKAMDRHEARNAPLLLATARLFSGAQLEPRHPGALCQLDGMIDRALRAIQDDSSSSGGGSGGSVSLSVATCDRARVAVLQATTLTMTEFGSGRCSFGVVQSTSTETFAGEAVGAYRTASSMDPSNVRALHGMIHCQLLMGQIDGRRLLSHASCVASRVASHCAPQAHLHKKP